ncbi:MAG: hypothetical protein JWQ42_1560 [Edaphobacter sp.]|nr:hypothetical protein [Edaphobacter sp.]
MSAAKKRSTWFSQLAEVGVKWKWKRGWRTIQRWMAAAFVGGIENYLTSGRLLMEASSALGVHEADRNSGIIEDAHHLTRHVV